jgi:LytR cell envelope-related transcriptional attenuator
VLVVALFALREPKGHVSSDTGTPRTVVSTVTKSSSPSKTTSSSKASSPSTSKSASSLSTSSSPTGVKAIPLIVLNDTSIAGLAKTATDKLRSDGWTVTRYDNYSNNIISTCAYYDPSVPGAKAAAEALQAQYSWIQRTKERFPELPSGPVVVVLTAGISSG